ncbi:MAG: hypothetical protein WCC06_09395 [Candidatus Aminicenantales bacterium]
MFRRKHRGNKASASGLSQKPDSYPPESVYNHRIKTLDVLLKKLKKQGTALGILKLSLVLGALLALCHVFTASPAISWGIVGLALVLFITTAVIHESIIRKARHLNALKTINKNEIKFLCHEFPEAAHTGEEFQNSDHYYTPGLDIFGEKGLFHYVNRSVTAIGRRHLAGWLQSKAEPEEIKKRQEAVAELSQKIDLRQNVASYGMFIDDSSQKLDSLLKFLHEPFLILGKKWLLVFMFVWPMLTICAAVSIIFKIPLVVFLSFALSQYAINKKFSKQLAYLYSLTSRSRKILKAYSRIIGEIETENFNSERLIQLKDRLSKAKHRASVCISRFSRLMEWFDARNGMLHSLFNNILLWDLHCVYHIEKWRKQTAAHVPQWFNVIGEFEALSGFAALHFNNPQWTMPEIHENSFRLHAQNLGHPLIPEKERVCSSIELGKNGKAIPGGNLAIVTGPNMAGKSTFLKAVGINTVLAFAGAPVCAERLVISPVKLMTSLKTSDSLDKHLSLFYAELQRLKMILDGISRSEPVFFLIDEILKGTNALDRQKGSIALLKQLMRSHANGIVATHDLELTKLENLEEWEKSGGQYPEGINIANYHFDGYIKEDKLLFDYHLKKGMCKSHNALLLMKNMGIDI